MIWNSELDRILPTSDRSSDRGKRELRTDPLRSRLLPSDPCPLAHLSGPCVPCVHALQELLLATRRPASRPPAAMSAQLYQAPKYYQTGNGVQQRALSDAARFRGRLMPSHGWVGIPANKASPSFPAPAPCLDTRDAPFSPYDDDPLARWSISSP
jgi:hypothetical protein